MAQRAAVIGAGLSGAACARRLADAGWDVELFDEGEQPGGRLATRRTETPVGPVTIDYGAPYISVRTDEFAAKMRKWVAAGVAETWSARIVNVDERNITRPATAIAWTGRPGMSAIVESEIAGLTVRYGAKVATVRGEPDLWRIIFEDGAERSFYHAVVVAVPSEPAAAILNEAAPFQASAARRVRMAPCWAAMIAYFAPLEGHVDGAHITRGPLSWVGRDASKPSRNGAETWMVHAGPGWSSEFAKLSPEEAAPKLVEAFRRRVQAPEPAWCEARFWPSATVERAVGSPFGWDQALKIGSCGDWYLGGRAELAWQSGDSLARAIIEDSVDGAAAA